MVELLKQPQYQPFNVIDQVLSIFAGTNGYLDDVPLNEVLAFEAALLKHFRNEHPEVIDQLESKRDLPNDVAEKVRGIIRDFKTHARGTREQAA